MGGASCLACQHSCIHVCCMAVMLKRFISYYSPHKGLLYLDMGTAIVRAAMAVCIPLIITRILRVYLPDNNLQMIIISMVILFFLVVGITFAGYINTKWGHILGTRMETDMRTDLFAHLQKLSFTYFDNTKTGHIMSRISNDLFKISEVAHHSPEDLLLSTAIIIGAFVVMFQYNAMLSIVAFIPLPIMLAWGALYRTRLRQGFRKVRKRVADINSSVENSIQGIREVKSFTNEEYEMDKFDGVNLEFRFAKEKMYGAMAGFHAGMLFIREGYFLLVMGAGTFMIHMGKLDLPTLVGFFMYTRFIMKPINRLVAFAEQYQEGSAAFERFVEIMDIEPDILDRSDAISPDRLEGEISIQDLCFKYNPSTDWVLKDLNLTVPIGKTVALVGESGAGKSTLAALIPRFYETSQGSIKIDGHNILDLKQRFLRKHVGIVQQNVFLFDSTVRENIMFGNPAASEEQFIDAMKKANIFDFVMELSDGPDTLIGERGVKLSGGQKQRVSIARVFLKKPEILIFDEATSSLDTESETLIQDSMSILCENVTTIIIAHRLSTVINADCIYVLRKGGIVEQGTHKELLAANGYYKDLYSRALF